METGTMYRAGIIGCGRIASTIEDEIRPWPGFMLFPYTHAGAYQRHPRTELAAAADLDASKLQAFGQRWGVQALYTDPLEMIEKERPEIISIATTSNTHCDLVLGAAERGVKGIFLEKPIARTLAEADSMIQACRSAGVKVAVNHTRTFDPYFRAAKALIENGEIGNLRAVFSTWGEGFAFGGSHLFDLLRYTVGSEPSWVFCQMEDDASRQDPGGDVYICYQNGVRAHLHMPAENPVAGAVEYMGSEGRIRMGTFEYTWWKKDHAGGITVVTERPFPGRNDGRSAMLTAVDELIRAIEGGPEPASSLEDGRKVLELTLAILQSGKTQQPCTLPFTDSTASAEAMW